MNIPKVQSIGFGALLGKREVKYYHGSGVDRMTTIQHIYPFKDEFKNSKDLKEAMDKFKNSDYFARQETNQGITASNYDIIVEKELGFTKDEFLRARQCPLAKDVSKKARDFIDSDEYNATTIKHFGYYPSILLEDGQVEFK